MATESYVQLTPDSSGKQVDTYAVTDAVTQQSKHRQAVVIGDPVVANNVMSVDATGAALVTDQRLYDLLATTNALLRVIAGYLYENPFLLGPRGPSDEPDNLLAEALNPSTFIQNQ